jgi:2-polyprenyl-6-methoxyphenol hydroxylase-like FAD-dependent oxidoreductase
LESSTQVVIAGGGPVGLAAAVELGRRGISCTVVEPRVTVSHARPRCKTVNVRTMEHLRRWGIADRLRAAAPLPPEWSQDVVFCTSMTGRELSRFTGVFGLAEEGERFAERGQQAPQFVLEELLRDVVAELPSCRLELGARVTGVEQDDREVRVTLDDGRTISSEYAIGCDGSRSAVRDAIGSSYVGEVSLRPNFGFVVSAPALWDIVAHGRAVHYWIINPEAPGIIGPLNQDGIWWGGFSVNADRGEAELVDLLTTAIGARIEVDVLSTDPWTAQMQVVDRARSGRVFLAGDAAHLNPPFGGHGLNTGVGDAVDLGWKLASVLQGWAGESLLDTYELERRPVQERVIAEAAQNMKVLPADLLGEDPATIDRHIQETKDAEFHALNLVLGEEGAGARPGRRLPHARLRSGLSLFDALGEGLTLLVFAEHRADDIAAFEALCNASDVPLTVGDLSQEGLTARYGADLVVVRPDQNVAWAADRMPDPAAVLASTTHLTTAQA